MASQQKTILVYDAFSSDHEMLMGLLYVNQAKGGESYSFEYDRDWLKKTALKFTLDPELMPYTGGSILQAGTSSASLQMPLLTAGDAVF